MATDIRLIDLNLLKALDALLDERNVTRAAERLALTQPAVSGMLTRLRECFDDQLFVRAQRGIVPTLRALELAGPVKQLLALHGLPDLPGIALEHPQAQLAFQPGNRLADGTGAEFQRPGSGGKAAQFGHFQGNADLAKLVHCLCFLCIAAMTVWFF